MSFLHQEIGVMLTSIWNDHIVRWCKFGRGADGSEELELHVICEHSFDMMMVVQGIWHRLVFAMVKDIGLKALSAYTPCAKDFQNLTVTSNHNFSCRIVWCFRKKNRVPRKRSHATSC